MSDYEVHPIGRVPVELAKRLVDDWWSKSGNSAEALQDVIDAHLDELAALVTPPQTQPVRREELRIGDRVRVVTDWTGVVTDTSCAIICVRDDEDGSVAWVSDDGATNTYLLDRPDPEPEPVNDEALVKVVVDWLRDNSYLSSSAENYARELVRRLYAKAV